MGKTSPNQKPFLDFIDEPSEQKMDAMDKIGKRAEAEQKARDKLKADMEFSRKAPWVKASLEGDYLPEDSGMNVGDREFEED